MSRRGVRRTAPLRRRRKQGHWTLMYCYDAVSTGGRMQDISFTVHIFKEGETYVAHVPGLDVSSCGETSAAARQNIGDAVRGFLEAAEESGTLEELLDEAGYRREGGGWRAPELVSIDRLSVGLG